MQLQVKATILNVYFYFSQDLHKLEAKLLEKRAKEEEAAEREDRLAKLKEKVMT